MTGGGEFWLQEGGLEVPDGNMRGMGEIGD